jgi:hypothetical protein
MKTFFAALMLIVIALVAAAPSQAQIVKTVTLSKDTLSSADTSIATITAEDYVRSFTVVATKVSGTVAGKAYFYASGDGTNYDLIDSLTVANVSGAQYKTFKPALPLVYYKYRVYTLSTNGVWALRVRQLTRR